MTRTPLNFSKAVPNQTLPSRNFGNLKQIKALNL